MRECGILNMSLRELNVKFPFYMKRMFASAGILFAVYMGLYGEIGILGHGKGTSRRVFTGYTSVRPDTGDTFVSNALFSELMPYLL